MYFRNLLFITFLLINLAFIITACNEVHAEKESTFVVYGNCGMCEKTIEGALEQKGIYKADWNKETKIISVRYDSTMFSLEQIHTVIADAGYDTEVKRAPDEAYDALHECCQYKRPL